MKTATKQVLLHTSQLEIFDSPARFKVVAAGRRFGKSHLAAIMLLSEGMRTENEHGYDVSTKEVYYIAPTFEQAKKIMWPLIKRLGGFKKDGGVIESTYENTAVLTLINGRRISLKGADRPDSLRGIGLSFCVMDEYAFMKPDVWSVIIRPALADVEGGALFIGTPDGKNHFYDIWNYANAHMPMWQAWQFESLKNPILNPDEIRSAVDSSHMTVAAAKQEFGASFNSGGGLILPEAGWRYGKEPVEGDYFIAVDLAGFSAEGNLKKGVLKIRDEHSICITKVNEDGWWVKEIVTGQWGVRETALRIIKAFSDNHPLRLGIEKGALKNAVSPYLDDEMRRLNRFVLVEELIHGGKAKPDRIRWSLQGRLEKRKITLNEEEDVYNPWQRKLIEQACDFPSPLSHDDMIDSLAYIDQLSEQVYFRGRTFDSTWQPLDIISGF